MAKIERLTYADDLKAMDDDALVKAAEMQCWLSAFASNNPRAPAHWKTDLIYDECSRREKPWLYARGWNAAYRSAGYEPSEHSLAAARAPA